MSTLPAQYDTVACPVCGDSNPAVTVTRAQLPAMQNHVFRTAEQAKTSARGRFALAACRSCGFCWNGAFSAANLEYDSGYDNAVPSTVMTRYYEEIASYLGRTYPLSNGYVVEIGCGNGTFLKVLAGVVPDVTALGVDPALGSNEVQADGRVRLVKGDLGALRLERPPSLIICRHVLEHIPHPVQFVRAIRTAVSQPGTPLFVEVPDLPWIVSNDAFWDFCYEHCNYFTAESLGYVLDLAGFRSIVSRRGFGEQYLWHEAVIDDTTSPSTLPPSGFASKLVEYARDEENRMVHVRAHLQGLRRQGAASVIWGMATKGVLFSLLADPDASLVDVLVDINSNKQGCYVPVSGRLIEAPAALQRFGERPLSVIVMNPNYASEIAETCRALRLRAELLDASGNALTSAVPH